MAVPHFRRFLAEATVAEQDPTHQLPSEQLFGLYLSWCTLNHQAPASEAEFRESMKHHRIHPSGTGLWRTGPAAMDYILNTYPALP
ncbi:hypothetical protein [Arthrobacter sp. NyZ413]|uniref:hypothetical protein n=1 Tax=Arthrobacter sp. NyZ413 TaxID=3144669 RepID=UPI002C4029DA|nr:hypothetical protein [Arthrobacter sp.]